MRRDVLLRASVDGDEVDLRVASTGDVFVGDDRSAVSVSGSSRGSALIVAVTAPAAGSPDPETNRATVSIDEGNAWVFLDGEVFRIEVTEARQERTRRRDRAGHDALAAPMPASVRRVLVETGQAVARGETLVLLEAMKMELPIRAPRDGRVSAIRCQPGELVQPGVPLLELDEAPPP
jgi:biotin carboxyl carrier protein